MPVTRLVSRATRHLRLVDLADGRYLANTAALGIRHLVYSTWTWYPDLLVDGETAVTTRPFFEVADLQPRCRVRLGHHDPYETGIVFTRLERVVWDDGVGDGPALLGRERGYLAAARGRMPPAFGPPTYNDLVEVALDWRELYTEPAGPAGWP